MSRKTISQTERDLARQPINKDGWSDDRFNELYGEDKNPHLGTERDRKNRKGTKMIIVPSPVDWLKNAKPWNWKKNGKYNEGKTDSVKKGKLGE